MRKEDTIIKAIKELETKLRKCDFKKYLKNHYRRVYEWIIDKTSFLDKYNRVVSGRNTLSIFERIYCIEHNLHDRPLCLNCQTEHVCGFNSMLYEYKKWCSPSCLASDKTCISKSKATRKKLYNNENYSGIEKSRNTRMKNNNGKWHAKDFGEKCKQSKVKSGHDPNWTNLEKAKKTIAKHIDENPNFWLDREQKTKATKIKNGRDPNWNNRELFKKTISSFTDERKKEIVEKRKQKNIEKNGYAYPLLNPTIRENIEKHFMKKYGVKSFFLLSYVREAITVTIKEKAWNRIISDTNYIPLFTKEEFIENRNPKKKWNWKCAKCNNIFSSKYDNGHHGVCRICNPYNTSSRYEKELYETICSLGVKAERGNRKVIYPKELDIYIDSKKLAIEFDGIYWHSELELTDKKYHLKKTEKCESKGIHLIHIFEDEWLEKRNIVESRIKNLLGIYDATVFARKCEVKEVSSEESNNFQERTHIQGFVNAKVNLGLFYEDKMIALMTFGKPRFNKKYEWELLRFCTELGYHIPGGAGKLLKYFERKYNPKSMISYADRRWSQGKIYKALEFELDHISGPDYWYLDENDKLHRYSRYKFLKHKLPKLLDNFNPKLSEVENMRNNEYTRIFDCGNLVFVKNFT